MVLKYATKLLKLLASHRANNTYCCIILTTLLYISSEFIFYYLSLKIYASRVPRYLANTLNIFESIYFPLI